MNEEELLRDVVKNGGGERDDCAGWVRIACSDRHFLFCSFELIVTGYFSVVRAVV